jgi:hypothetical protein
VPKFDPSLSDSTVAVVSVRAAVMSPPPSFSPWITSAVGEINTVNIPVLGVGRCIDYLKPKDGRKIDTGSSATTAI